MRMLVLHVTTGGTTSIREVEIRAFNPAGVTIL